MALIPNSLLGLILLGISILVFAGAVIGTFVADGIQRRKREKKEKEEHGYLFRTKEHSEEI